MILILTSNFCCTIVQMPYFLSVSPLWFLKIKTVFGPIQICFGNNLFGPNQIYSIQYLLTFL